MQRALKFAKYLPEFGYEPIIFTAENNEQLGRDESLLADVSEKTKIYRSRIPMQPSSNNQNKSFVESKGIGQRLKRWLRGNIFLPDAKIGWLYTAKPVLKQIFEAHKIDCVFVTAPPQTTHLIGRYIKKKYTLPVVHDFRDPWTDAFFLKDFNRGKLAHFFDSILERRVLRSADHITTVSNGLGQLLNTKSQIIYTVIANGFDEEIAAESQSAEIKNIVYTGTIADSQIPLSLFEYFRQAEDVTLTIYGNVHSSFTDAVREFSLEEKVQINSPVSHDEVLQIQRDADCLLLLIPKMPNSELIVTGKIFEYFASRKPILAFGSEDGDAALLLSDSKLGKLYSYNTPAEELGQFFKDTWEGDLDYLKTFHRRELTAKLARVLERL